MAEGNFGKNEKDGQCECVIDGSALLRQVKLVILRSISSNVSDEASCQPTSKVTRKYGAVLWSLYIAYRPNTGRQVGDSVLSLTRVGMQPHEASPCLSLCLKTRLAIAPLRRRHASRLPQTNSLPLPSVLSRAAAAPLPHRKSGLSCPPSPLLSQSHRELARKQSLQPHCCSPAAHTLSLPFTQLHGDTTFP